MRDKLNKLLLEIPKGKVTTYKILANKLNTHPRAIAMLLHTNPFPTVYPCYKVIASDGSLSGYALGIEKKKELLENEGIRVKDTISQDVIHHF